MPQWTPDVIKKMASDPYYGSELPVGEPSFLPKVAKTVGRAADFVYDVARTPITASENITKWFQEEARKSQPQVMSEQERIARIAKGPPTLGESVGRLSELGTEVMSAIPDPIPEAALMKKFGAPLVAGLVRSDIVKQMKPITRSTARTIKRWLRPGGIGRETDRMVQVLKTRGFTADTDKQLMKFVKKFYKEAPDDFLDFINKINVHGDPGDMTLRKGIAAAYSPYPTASFQFPHVMKGSTGGHEVKHALWDWMTTKMVEQPERFSSKVHSFMSRSDWRSPQWRRDWFDMAESMESLRRRGIINEKEHLAAYQRFQKYYRKAIPVENMANVFSRAWLEEGMSMDEALKVAMKAGSRVLEKQKVYRRQLRRDFHDWVMSQTKLSQAESVAKDFDLTLAAKKAELTMSELEAKRGISPQTGLQMSPDLKRQIEALKKVRLQNMAKGSSVKYYKPGGTE